ncbi:MAG: PAS domain-containing protein [Acidobacteria bacterium]|nr:PAS domain-containing protein [Acidobacteriota bacterium]
MTSPQEPDFLGEAPPGVGTTSYTDLEDLKRALDQAIILAVTDVRGRILEVNRAFCEISGYSESELLGQDHRTLNSGHHSKAFFKQFWTTILDGRVWRGEIKNLAKDGRPYWVDTVIIPHLDSEGRPVRFLALRMDITARKQAESALQGSGKLLRGLLQGPLDEHGDGHLGQLVQQIGRALDMRWVVLIRFENPTSGKATLLTGRDGDRAVPTCSFSIDGTIFAAARREGAPFLAQDLSGTSFPRAFPLRPEGPVSLFSVPVRESTGQVIGLLATLDPRPLDRLEAVESAMEVFAAWAGAEMEWVRTRAFLHHSETSLAIALEELRAGLWERDLATDELRVSPGIQDLLGLNPAALPMSWEEWLDLVHPEDRTALRKGTRDHLEGRAPSVHLRLRLRHADGTWIRVSHLGKVVSWNDRGEPQGMVGLLTDITALWAREEALRETQKLESLGLLAGSISHDFNNLLLALRGHSELATEMVRLGQDPTEALAKLEVIVDRSTELVRQLLDYSGRGNRATEVVDLGRLVREMAGLLEVSVPKRIRLSLDIPGGLPPVLGDPTQLRQVVLNLVTNAADAIDGVSGTISLLLYSDHLGEAPLEGALPLAELQPGPYLILEVADTGCGMDEALRAKIFEPFFTTKQKGRGLGLASLQGIVRSHGGSLGVSSTPGSGSTFRIYLPAKA